MSKDNGWPIPPAAPRMATFRSGSGVVAKRREPSTRRLLARRKANMMCLATADDNDSITNFNALYSIKSDLTLNGQFNERI